MAELKESAARAENLKGSDLLPEGVLFKGSASQGST
jgi:hypothetical protein